jgi:Uri superfamily endonuclease
MKIQALKVGQKVEHPKYGVYTVIESRINSYGDQVYTVANGVDGYEWHVDHKDDIETGDIKVIKE